MLFRSVSQSRYTGTYQTLQQLATQQPNKNRTRHEPNQATSNRVKINKTYDQPTTTEQCTQVNPSCLLAYLGIKGYGSMTSKTTTKDAYKNAVPILTYYDIFKNYYANTQEDKF